jgi:cysteine desulfurase
MAATRCYLDHNATMPLHPAALEAMCAAAQLAGNPSSLHAEGRAARAVIEEARRAVAVAAGAKAAAVIFTSGGTESANMLLQPDWVVERSTRRISDLFVLATDHACILAGGSFEAQRVHRIPVHANGLMDEDALDAMLAKSQFPMVALHHANNETGIVQPIERIAALARRHLALIVVDAVQSFGKIPLDFSSLDIDALFVSGHKIGGPKGAGATIFANTRVTPAYALIEGGGQQKGFRAGTENLPGIAGFGAAALHVPHAIAQWTDIAKKRDEFERLLLQLADGAVIFGQSQDRLPNTSLFAIPGQSAELSLIAYDLAGFAVSSGAACSSGKVKRSHVLDAMGIAPALAEGAIRMSAGPETTKDDLARFIAAISHRISQASRNSVNTAAKAA